MEHAGETRFSRPRTDTRHDAGRDVAGRGTPAFTVAYAHQLDQLDQRVLPLLETAEKETCRTCRGRHTGVYVKDGSPTMSSLDAHALFPGIGCPERVGV